MKWKVVLASALFLGVFAGSANAVEKTATGFYYPIGTSNFSSECGTWLGQDGLDGRPGCYDAGKYHIGVDMMTPNIDANAYAISDGTVFYRDCNDDSWGAGNCALFIRHRTAEGKTFTGLYAHLIKSSLPQTDEVIAGNSIGKTGNYSGGIHLHFGIRMGDSITPSPWGRMPNEKWVSDNPTNGFISPVDFIENNSPASCQPKPIISQLNYFWTPGLFGNNCEMGTAHYRIEDGPTQCAIVQVSSLEACTAIASRCQQSSVGSDTDSRIVSFIQSILGRQALAASDYPTANFPTLCNETVSHTDVCSLGGQVQFGFENGSGHFVSYPTIQTVGPIKPDPLPNLHITSVDTRDENGNTIEEGATVNVGQLLDVRVLLRSDGGDCVDGIEAGKDTVETDIFYKIALSENEGGWKFLERVYTRCSNLDESDTTHDEHASFTVPQEASGKRIYFKAKVDSTGEVNETNEYDNWSDGNEWHPVPGSFDLITSYARLTSGRTTLLEGDSYGFEMALKNLGPDSCPFDIRSAYYIKHPGETTWQYLTDDESLASELTLGREQYELTLNEPFTATAVGTHHGMVCADYLGSAPESNEGNNCTEFSFEVLPKAPDFVIDSIGLTNSRNSLSVGEYFGLTLTVTNSGNANSSGDIRSAYYFMPPGITTWQYMTDDGTMASTMCAGCSAVEITTNEPFMANVAGNWQIRACADYQGNVSELNENNNCKESSFVVNAVPTGAVDSISCSSISGWAKDDNVPGAINLHVYKGDYQGNNKTYVATVTANGYRADVGYHGFSWNIPASFKDGSSFTLFFYAIDFPEQPTNPIIGNTSLSCAAPIYNLYPVYRAYSPVLVSHFYTISEAEKNSLLNSSWWIVEGLRFYAHDRQEPNTTPVYRLYRTNHEHYFTINLAEKNSLVSSGWIYEGISFYAYSSQQTGSVPIYRLYKESISDHLFTADVNEKNSAVANGYIYEGVGWYAYLGLPPQ